MPCPHCHQNAPIVYKGVFAFCSACNRPRAPFSGTALHFAGQPSKLGGRLGRALGFVVLLGGLLLAAALMLFFQLLIPSAMIGYALGLPVALISLVLGAVFLFTSRRLRQSGSDAERQARVEALYGLAVHRGGTLTAEDAARTLRVETSAADSLLSELAKTEPEHVSLEFDDEGQTFYLFKHAGVRAHPFGAKYRVSTEGTVQVSDVLGVDDPREEHDLESSRPRRSER